MSWLWICQIYYAGRCRESNAGRFFNQWKKSPHYVFQQKRKKKKFGAPKNIPKEDDTTIDTTKEDETPKKNNISDKKELKEDNEVKPVKPSEKNTIKKQKPKIKKETPVKGEKQKVNPKTEGKRARLIIRNLAHKCNPDDLTTAFSAHGDVIDVHIPRKKNKTRLGFAFIQMGNKSQAGMAMKALTGKELKGRKVAVDWALPKDKYEAKQESKAESSDSEEEMEVVKSEPIDDASEEEEDMDEDTKNSEDEDDDKSEDSESEDDESAEESEEDDESSDEDENESKETKSKPKDQPTSSDVEEGRTIFVRNLPFSVDEEGVVEFFSQYGDVKYAKLVKDKASGMPRGSAFVQFKSKDFADKCLEASGGENGSNLSMAGRDIYISLAVSRQKAGEMVLKKDDKKDKKDTRNLYLAREGMIRSGTAAAKDVPESDLLLRTKIDAAKRRKLKDQNVFVSSVRLCIHNLPTTVTDKQLRKVCLKATEDKTAKITECRIMRDLERPNAEGVGKSRGYAFCSFKTHEHALAALRWLNNNAEAFSEKKRPIVEFSLENRKALEAKEKRLEKSKARQPIRVTKENDASSKKKRRKNKIQQGGDAKPLTVRKQQDQMARSIHEGKPLGLPSHSGPKQRHKPRPSQQLMQDAKRNKKLEKNKKFERRERETQVPMPKPGKRKNNNTDSFDKLVASYKQKIMKSAQNIQL